MLTARNICFSSPSGDMIVDDVSLEVAAGDRLAIIGPNGAGKTTLLKLLSGMARPRSGCTWLFEKPIASMRPLDRARHVAVVGQTDQPDRRVRLNDYVALGRIPHSGRRSPGEDAAIVEAAIDRTGLSALTNREIGSLSGGERQRAQIARALAQEPQILFLDEPTNHLDPRARGTLLALVAELNLTVVAVLHDLHLVPDFATRVAILRGGRLVASGAAADALSKETVRDVFGIDLLRLPHPQEDREITIFDIPLKN